MPEHIRDSIESRGRATLQRIGVQTISGGWIVDRLLLACAYPRHLGAWRALQSRGIELLINLHERPHPPELLARFGIATLHLPTSDFTPPSPEALALGVEAIRDAIALNRPVAVHCGAGLGRTGTLLACYLTTLGTDPAGAIAVIRTLRPGSIETAEQERAIAAFDLSRSSTNA